MKSLVAFMSVAILAVIAVTGVLQAPAGEVTSAAYKVLEPIRHGNLSVFPVVSAISHDTQGFLTLDEGLRSGEVVVSEYGAVSPLVRPRHPGGQSTLVPGTGQVNQLVLVNNSKRPLILLAGEIVTGGKQDRVIGKDRIVPAESDPINVAVFCVEPGRWTGPKMSFNSENAPMAAPTVRAKAMAEKDQQQVWSEVRKAQAGIAAQVPAPVRSEVGETTSYAKVMQNNAVRERIDEVAAPIQHDYQSVIRQLRDRQAVGVVVAVNGEIIWADIFASTSLLEKYWPKLVRSYAADAFVAGAKNQDVEVKAAQRFLEDLEGRHEMVETEPGLYRHTEVTGDSFKAFELTSLLPKTGFDLHVAKMAD